MVKNGIAKLMIGALLLAVASGCAGGAAGNTGNKAGGQQGGAAAGEGGSVTLKLMQFKVEITDQVQAMVKDYMAQHPNVRIEAQVTRDYETLLKTRFASGDEPDIFATKAYTEMADWSDRLADLSNEPWMAQVAPAALPGMTVNDQKLGFPFAFEGYGFIYNKDLFAKAGIEQPPVTLSELKQVNEKLKAAGISSFSEGYKEWWILAQHLFNLPFAYDKTPEETIRKINEGQMTVSELSHMNGFFDVLDMTLQYGKGAESVGISYDQQVSDFASGKTAMMQQGVWTINSILKINPDIKMGMFAIPLTENAEDTRMPVGVPGYYVVNKNSKHVAEAKKFLDWLHQNGQKYLVESFLLIPAFTDLKTTSELGPLAADLSRYVDNDKTIPWAHTLWPAGANQEFAKPLQAYVGQQMNREQALKEVQAIWDARKKK